MLEAGMGVYQTLGSAPVIARDHERKEDLLRQEQAISRDTINISEAARELLRMREGGETPGDMPGKQGRGRNLHQG